MPSFSLERQYKISDKKIPALSWEEYVRTTRLEYEQLLAKSPHSETELQEFFERNPAYVPGGCDLDDGSGHPPYPYALIIKPELHGVFQRIPDFMWLASYSGVFHPILVEIEAPSKRCFNNDNSCSQELNHALDQLRQWRVWMEDPANSLVFMKHIRLEPHSYLMSHRFLPKYLLIYGRRSEIEDDSMKKLLREQMVTDGVMKIRSYDGLTPSYKSKDCFSVKLTERGYEAVEIMPTLQIHPASAEDYAVILGKEEAIKRNRYMSEERKEFLIERFQYWDDWVKTTPHHQRGVLGPDWE